MLSLRGAAALSEFRLEKLAEKITTIHPDIRLLHTEFVHFVQLRQAMTEERGAILASLLAYGPQSDGADLQAFDDVTLLLVVPRPGTISPWSSKATDIAHNCGLGEVERLERGVAWYVNLPDSLDAAARAAFEALVHDRMTETILPSLEQAEALFAHAAPQALTTVDILA